MALCRASRAPFCTFAAAIAVGSMLTACGGTSTDGNTITSETSSTTEAPVTSEGPVTRTETTVIETPVSPAPTSPAEMPTSPGEGSGDVTIEIPSPGIPAPPAIPQPPGPMP
ncbi:hypothetical protein JVX93_23180 [Mycolicibacterium boenickei]|nr:hypothetical protein JVX93_23180 [Mycolicibacterium boenickei]